MSDYRRADEVLDEEGIDDEAQTLVARNPMGVVAAEPPPESPNPPIERESTILVRESEIEFVSESAPDLELSPRGETAPAAGGDEAERGTLELRDSELEGLLAEVQDIDEAELKPAVDSRPTKPGPKAAESRPGDLAPKGAEDEPTDPTLSPEPLTRRSSRRNTVTERNATIPRTHPFANSIAPTAAPKSVPPSPLGRSAWPTALAALGLVLLGGGLARFQEAFFRSAPEGAQEPAEHAAVALPRHEEQSPLGEVEESVNTSAIEGEPAAPTGEEGLADGPIPQAEAPASASDSEPPVRNAREPRGGEAEPGSRRGAARRAKSVAATATVAAEVPAGVPAQPPREAVVSVMDDVAPELAQCTGGRRGIAEVSLTVRSGGQVTYALVDGSFAGTPEGTCMAQALRQVRFPAFSDPMVRIHYPFHF